MTFYAFAGIVGPVLRFFSRYLQLEGRNPVLGLLSVTGPEEKVITLGRRGDDVPSSRSRRVALPE